MSAPYTPSPELKQLRSEWENASHRTVKFDDRWLRLAQGTVEAIFGYGTAQNWEELEAWGETLKSVAARFADKVEIQLALAKGAVRAISRYGTAYDWTKLGAWSKTLKGVAANFAKDAKIQLELAKGAVNAMYDYGTAHEWEKLETWGDTLKSVATNFAKDAKIQLELAKSAVNAISRYGTAYDWAKLGAWSKTLKGVAADFAEDAKIQLELAKCAVRAIWGYSTNNNWVKLEEWGGRLKGVAAHFANVAKIQLALTKGAVRAISGYGKAQKWDELEAWGKTLKDIATTARFAKDAKIQLELAKGAVNAILFYGAAQKWDELEEWDKTLKGVAKDFAKDAKIQLELARGAFNAILRYGAAQKWDELEAWGKTLKGVATTDRFAKDAKIQLELAKSAVNAISYYGKAQKWEKLENWGMTLKELDESEAHDHDKVSKVVAAPIQLQLANGAVNAILYYGRAQAFVEMEAWGETLKGVAARFAVDKEIQLTLAKGVVNAMIPYRKTGKSKNMEKWKETEEREKWNQWGQELREIIKTQADNILSQFFRAEEKEFFRFAGKWERDDDFCELLGKNEELIKNENLRELWEAQEDVIELLRVEFSDTPEKEENGAVYQVAHYISVEDLERMIKPEELQLKGVSSTNDPTEGKIFQQFLNTETAEKFCSSEMLIAVQASFTCYIDGLNQFRLYGNLPDAPGTGLCLVFDKNFFADDSYGGSFINLPKRKRPDTGDKKSTNADEAQDHLPLYWVLYYNYRNNDKPFFIHTPTQCALRVVGQESRNEQKYSWASDRNTAISHALEAVREKYLKIIKDANKIIEDAKEKIKRADSEEDEVKRSLIKTAAEERKKAAWNLLIYLRHLVKDAAFAEEQEMRILKLCRFGDEKIRRLNPTKDLLGLPYLHILDEEHCVKKVIAGPKMEKFISRSTRWRHEIAQYAQSKEPPLSFAIEFSQSNAPLA